MAKELTHKLDVEMLLNESRGINLKPQKREDKALLRIKILCDNGSVEMAEKMFNAMVESELKRGKGKLSKEFEWVDRVKSKRDTENSDGLPGP